VCGGGGDVHRANHEQLVRLVRASPHFQASNGRNHLLVATDFKAEPHLAVEVNDPSGLGLTVIGHHSVMGVGGRRERGLAAKVPTAGLYTNLNPVDPPHSLKAPGFNPTLVEPIM
jgi:hypothetical protein